jgi:hypothetical protein
MSPFDNVDALGGDAANRRNSFRSVRPTARERPDTISGGDAMTIRAVLGLAVFAIAASANAADGEQQHFLRSAKSGPWSAATTWEGGRIPAAGDRVQIRPNHEVVYDVAKPDVIRMVHVGGKLSFARDRDTLLNVGLILVQPGESASETGFDCDAHVAPADETMPQPVFEIGSANAPIDAGKTATVWLHYVTGMDKESCPAIVCCGGRMDLHGAPLSRTWLKLGAPVTAGDTRIELQEAVTGWKPGDRIFLTATVRQNKSKKTFVASVKDSTQTEERIIRQVDGKFLTLDRPLAYDHVATVEYRGDVANLSRNVVIESADPTGLRGHTMYHRGSAGSISYAELRHLGKEGVLGRYSLHYHLCRDTMRGSSVIGASIWDSDNRWLTIHGTNYLVVRDCVGYRSKGHGFFCEDGTEVYNVFDRNLAVQAFNAKPLPKQVIPFDKNDGAGFWWANCLNTFTRNVACECDEYGYFFQAAKTPDFDPVLQIQQPDGSKKPVDIRTLPFVRFEDNESVCQRRHGFNLGGGVPFGKPNVDGVGPDEKHPLVIKNFRSIKNHWCIHPVSPSVLLDHVDIRDSNYGVWRPVYDRHVYRDVSIVGVEKSLHYAFVNGPPPAAKLDPVDDSPPITVITHVRVADGKVQVRGTASDDGTIKSVRVNGVEARSVSPNFAEWEVNVPIAQTGGFITSQATDAAGNQEARPHRVAVSR